MLSIENKSIVLSVIMLNVIMLNAVAPFGQKSQSSCHLTVLGRLWPYLKTIRKCDTQHNDAYCLSLTSFMLSITNKSIMMSVIMLNVIMFNVMAPSGQISLSACHLIGAG